MQTLTRFASIVASAGLLALSASCVDGAGSDDTGDAGDDAATSAALQELGGSSPTFYPLVRQNSSLGAWLYDELGKRWLRWAMGLPWSTGPINDPDGSACGLGQSGPVWNLAGTTFEPEVTRSCTIPFGRFLYFPMVNTWVTPPPSFITETEDEAYWTDLATTILTDRKDDLCSLTLRYDGHEVPSDPSIRPAETYVEILDPFPVLFNDDNYTGGGFDGGVWPLAYMNGQFALLLPPLPGDHVLEMGGALCDPSGEPYFSTKVTWNLHVQ